ncbi:MAG TPA: cytochrome c peroxidase [Gemmatimonadaceae bacterium]|jgi:cytochrome c peroxidase
MRRTRTRTLVGALVVAASLSACRDEASAPATTAPEASASLSKTPDNSNSATVALVRQLTAGRGVVPLPRRPHVRNELAQLGQALAFDPILSGNRNISCMTCHMPQEATGDGKSLSVGEGGMGFGPRREHPQGVFIPRNAPPLFNMAAMQHLFWDGRISSDAHGKITTPAGDQVTAKMQKVFEFGSISAIGMFPVGNRLEMRGENGDKGNELAKIDDADNPAIWNALMKRLGDIPEYRQMFRDAYPGTRFEDMTFAYASNAIGGFIVDKLTFDDTPWDRFLAGDDRALNKKQLAGAQTFMTLKCSLCHNGATLSDEQFHDVAVAQVGPGEGDGSGADDFGRMRVTGLASDRYLFRTTPLRNVELTAPYGHDGSIMNLRDFVEHYSESDIKLAAYDPMQLEHRLRGTLQPTQSVILAQRDTIIRGVVLTDSLVDNLMDYMTALTDDAARHLNRLVPDRVPSRLPVMPSRF